MKTGDERQVEWFVAFAGDDVRYWWDRFCRPGFRHVLAFRWAADGMWLVFNPNLDRLRIDAMPGAFVDQIIARANQSGGGVLRVSTRSERRSLARFGWWCVPAVAALIGIRTRALRPQTLWRDLLARGAVPAFRGE